MSTTKSNKRPLGSGSASTSASKKPKTAADVKGFSRSDSTKSMKSISRMDSTRSMRDNTFDPYSLATGEKISFDKELASVMYGFGDTWNTLPETIELMNKIVIEYMEDMTKESMLSALSGKLNYNCLKHALRHQDQKVDRINQLIKINRELKEKRKQGLAQMSKPKSKTSKGTVSTNNPRSSSGSRPAPKSKK